MTSVKIDGSAIRRLREENELTQLYLATVVGVTTDTISRWENNKYPAIKLENAEKLAEALGVELEDIQEKEKQIKRPEHESEKHDKQQAESESVAPKDNIITAKRKLFLLAGTLLLIALIGGGVLFWQKTKVPVVWAKRTVPTHTAPGLPFPVIIRLSADGSTNIPILLRETITGEAVARGITSDRGKNSQDFGANPRWIGRLVDGQAAFLYMVHPGKDLVVGEVLNITGDCISGKTKKNTAGIAGPGSVTITLFHWADTDKDHVITDHEILNAYELYSSLGNVEVDFHDLEMLWLAGGYRWDEQTKVLVPIPKGTSPQGE
ncbi:MAG: hypothetical protein CSA26_00820 [Desulfobacterales bacterium]|nr:MAG: hypothetical protein CSA26_00820 [Desulfobacterales bacterium]